MMLVFQLVETIQALFWNISRWTNPETVTAWAVLEVYFFT